MTEQLPSAEHAPSFSQGSLALCLSGGGLRATLFHLGVVERLYLLGALDKVGYLSTVSGGSILGALVLLRWEQLLDAPHRDRTDMYDRLIAQPVRAAARADLRNRAIRSKVIRWRTKSSERLATLLDRYLYHGATLGELPPPSLVRAAINCTNLSTGKRFRFSRDSLGDYQSGYTYNAVEHIPVATAAAASAAYPLFFGPLVLGVQGPFYRWTFSATPKPIPVPDPPYGMVNLIDGGVYDNLGIEAALQRCGELIVSDASSPLDFRTHQFGILSAVSRSLDVLMNRTTSQYTRRLVRDLLEGRRSGTLIRMSSSVEHVTTVEAGDVPVLADPPNGLASGVVELLAQIRTDLDRFTQQEMELLQFHGSSLAHTALSRFQRHLVEAEAPPITPAAARHPDLSALRKASERRFRSVLFAWRGF